MADTIPIGYCECLVGGKPQAGATDAAGQAHGKPLIEPWESSCPTSHTDSHVGIVCYPRSMQSHLTYVENCDHRTASSHTVYML